MLLFRTKPIIISEPMHIPSGLFFLNEIDYYMIVMFVLSVCGRFYYCSHCLLSFSLKYYISPPLPRNSAFLSNDYEV